MTISDSVRFGLSKMLVVVGLIGIWVFASAGLIALSESAPGALIIFPSKALVARLPGHVRIVDWQKHRLVVTSEKPGYIKALYRAGAWLVMPARKNGCLALSADR